MKHDSIGASPIVKAFSGYFRATKADHLAKDSTWTAPAKYTFSFLPGQEPIYYPEDNVVVGPGNKIEELNRYETEEMDNIFYDLDVSMYLVNGKFNESIINNFADNAESKYISLSMPKFKFEYSSSLKNFMQNLGVNFAFDTEKADFRDMFDSGNMFITDAIHKTYINVNEKGTEAAAVTAVMMAGSALPPQPIEVKFNKPFTFVIRDNDNGELLFMGRFAFAEEN